MNGIYYLLLIGSVVLFYFTVFYPSTPKVDTIVSAGWTLWSLVHLVIAESGSWQLYLYAGFFVFWILAFALSFALNIKEK